MAIKKRLCFVVLCLLFIISISFVVYSYAFKKDNGEYCSAASECYSNWCNGGICCDSPSVCCIYQVHCPSGFTCNTETHACEGKATDGSSCEYETECASGWCEDNICCAAGKSCCRPGDYCGVGYECGPNYYCISSQSTPPSAYCGDGSCNGGETCSSCSSDCGSCETTTKSDGEYCSLNYECDSGNCRNNICCTNGRLCCDDDNDCQQSCLGCWCSTSDHFCYEPQSQDACATVICKTGYKCVNGDCISTGTKEFCQSCSDGSDCASGACLTFSDGISRCGSTISTLTCCGDGKGIENLQKGVDCCETTGCNSGYKCVSYKCVLDLTTTPEKKANGERCKSDSECQSGNCNWLGLEPDPSLYDGACCQPGEYCCDEVGITTSFPDKEGWYECNSEYYLFKQEEKETSVGTGVGCPSGTCDVVEGCTHGEHPELRIEDCALSGNPTWCKEQQEIIQKKCIENGAHNTLFRKDNSNCAYICCDGVIKDFGEAYSGPDCCTNADCEAGKECKGNYCVETASGQITNFVKGLFKFLQSKCASSLQCEDDEFCSEEWECKKLVCSKCDYAKDHVCSQCEYAKDHQCVRYQCCSDSECGVLQKCDTSIHKCVERNDCIQIINNGDSNSKIDIAFIGEGYSDNAVLKEDVLKLVDYEGNNGYYGLMSVEPFKSGKKKFNIWMMNSGFSIPYKLSPYEPDTVKGREVAAKCTVSDYQIIVSKKSGYRSFCFFGGPCFVSLGNGDVDEYDGKVLVHEFAHGFGRIADEYVEEPMGNRPREPNCVSDKAEAEKLWGDLVKTQSGYGYYEGCSYTKNNFRPTPTSIMRYPYTTNAEFYLVNERFIQTRLDMYK